MDEGEFPGDSIFPSIATIPDIPGDEPVILRGMEIREQLAELGLGKREASIGAAIALCTSPGPSINSHSTADFSLVTGVEGEFWGPCFGGFQIRSLMSQYDTGLVRDAGLLPDPLFNIAAAVALKRLYGWEYWSSYGSVDYNNFMAELEAETGHPGPVKHVILPGEVEMHVTRDGANLITQGETNG